jgi:alpha-beta hydrolase superfamily lysophospholipase
MRSMQRKRRFKRLGYFLGVLVLAYLGVCWYLSSEYLSPPRGPSAMTPPFVNEVIIPTRGGSNPTWVTKNFDAAPVVVVLAFGNGGIRGSFTELTHDLVAQGFAAVTPCMPGQDASPEKTIGFGLAEARTLEDTVAWVRSNRADHPKVVLYGVSMGGAACWLATSDNPPVDGIITESAYAELAPTVDQFFNRSIPGGSVVFRPVVWIAQWRSGLRVSDINPVRNAESWHGRPALVIQAGEDDLVNPKQWEQLVQATGGEYWLVSGAKHAGCYEHDPKAYVSRIAGFLSRQVQALAK